MKNDSQSFSKPTSRFHQKVVLSTLFGAFAMMQCVACVESTPASAGQEESNSTSSTNEAANDLITLPSSQTAQGNGEKLQEVLVSCNVETTSSENLQSPGVSVSEEDGEMILMSCNKSKSGTLRVLVAQNFGYPNQIETREAQNSWNRQDASLYQQRQVEEKQAEYRRNINQPNSEQGNKPHYVWSCDPNKPDNCKNVCVKNCLPR